MTPASCQDAKFDCMKRCKGRAKAGKTKGPAEAGPFALLQPASRLLQRQERQVPGGVLLVQDRIDVLGPERRALVPQPQNARRRGGDLVVDLAPRLSALLRIQDRLRLV